MANDVKLEIYTIRLRPSGNKEEFLDLSKFDEDVDFLDFFTGYIKDFNNQLEKNEAQKKAFKLNSDALHINSGRRTISGIIGSGEYGFASTFFNNETGEEEYQRGLDSSENIPFYFLIYLPKKQTKGFVILQRFGVHGIHIIFKSHLTKYLKGKYPYLQLDFNPYVSKELAQQFINDGSIQEYTLTRYSLPPDVADQLGMAEHVEDVMSISLVIKAKRKRKLEINDRVKGFINDPNARVFDAKPLKDLGFDGEHKSKIKVKFGNNIRTMDLSDTGQIRPYYDIDAIVDKDEATMQPVFKSIDTIANNYLGDLINELGL